MNKFGRGAVVAAMLLSATLLSACTTTGDDDPGIAANDQPSQLTPVPDSAVSSDALPPIGGATKVASADPAAVPQNDDPGLVTGATAAGAAPATGAAAGSGSFVSLNDVGQAPSGPGRDLSGGLSVEKLLGGWTVTSGDTQCRLNLTYTAADASADTDRYRASAPGCQMPTLAAVASWELSGTQVQLFNDSDKMVGTLLLSGNRFIGTLSGGQAISMVG